MYTILKYRIIIPCGYIFIPLYYHCGFPNEINILFCHITLSDACIAILWCRMWKYSRSGRCLFCCLHRHPGSGKRRKRTYGRIPADASYQQNFCFCHKIPFPVDTDRSFESDCPYTFCSLRTDGGRRDTMERIYAVSSCLLYYAD